MRTLIYAKKISDKLLALRTNHRYTVRVLTKRRYTMTYETITEETLVNVVNWCTEQMQDISVCLVQVLSSPATMQIINNWHSVYN